MWESILDKMLSRLIRIGQLRVTYPNGNSRTYGPGPYGPDGATAGLRIADAATLRALCLRPELALGEGYMNETIRLDGCDLETLLRLLMQNRREGGFPLWVRAVDYAGLKLRAVLLRNTADSAKRNVAHHYDLSDDLYQLFLDRDMQYSCGYFSDPAMSLEDAQIAKKAHIASKLCIEPGMRVLDIGCGWGGMALTLARDYGARVTGVTLSENQQATAQTRVRDAGLEDRIDIRLQDYRALDDQYDRIVSVGMLEHVGAPHYSEYFNQVARLLDTDGVALIHTIGWCGRQTARSAWMTKYIFPGGYVPPLSELAPAIEISGLWTLDLEIWRLHYAMTLRHWLHRFEDNIGTVRRTHDERFVRMWRYYLTICILAFEVQQQGVFQFQLAHKRDAAPLTRDYLYTTPMKSMRAAE